MFKRIGCLWERFADIESICKEKKMLVKKVLAILIAGCIMIICSSQTAPAEDLLYFQTSLPDEFSYDMDINSIEKDIMLYIKWLNLDIAYGTEEYAEFISDLCFTNTYPELDSVTMRYYNVYGLIYLDNNNLSNLKRNILQTETIQDIRERNKESAAVIQKQWNENNRIPMNRSNEKYSVIHAREYAQKYAVIPNVEGYSVYTSDCTNFASQIIRAAGFSPNSNWYHNKCMETLRGKIG